MTTIAYHHESKTIAVDSRICRHDIVQSDSFSKVIERGDVRLILCGIAEDMELFADLYTGVKSSDLIPDCYGVAIDDGVIYSVCLSEDGNVLKMKCQYNEAHGSGERFALSAMDHGKGAKEAVEYAMTRDIYTGGEVRVIQL